eukprot:2516163-Heterocapsa_arctica.AAC.1
MEKKSPASPVIARSRGGATATPIVATAHVVGPLGPAIPSAKRGRNRPFPSQAPACSTRQC